MNIHRIPNHTSRFLTLLLTAILITGCMASKKDKFVNDMMAKGVEPLSATEITELLSGASQYTKNPKYEYQGTFTADGRTSGRAWWDDGEETGEGTWTATIDNLLCQEYSGKWGKAGKRCYALYPTSGEYNITGIQKSGSQPKGYPDGIIPMKITPTM